HRQAHGVTQPILARAAGEIGKSGYAERQFMRRFGRKGSAIAESAREPPVQQRQLRLRRRGRRFSRGRAPQQNFEAVALDESGLAAGAQEILAKLAAEKLAQ